MPHQARQWALCLALMFLVLGLAGQKPAHAVALAEVLRAVETAPDRAAICREAILEATPEVLRLGQREPGGCHRAVAELYLLQLRRRALHEVVETAVESQNALVGQVQAMVESGAGSEADLLMTEIELKRLQLEEAALGADLVRGNRFFETVVKVEPGAFSPPRLDLTAWPESEAAALAALPRSGTAGEDALTARRWRLLRAWSEEQAAERRIALLRPMRAFAQDLARASRERFDIGRLSLADLQAYLSDEILQQQRMVAAEADQLAARIRVLELLGRRAAFE